LSVMEINVAEPEPSVGYQSLEKTVSICPECLTRVDAEIAVKDDSVFLLKNCPEHGEQVALLEKNAEYYKARVLYDKPGTASKIQTASKKGCPFDCGICPEHKQHTCIGLIEINGDCELACPDCYTGHHSIDRLNLNDIEKMMDFYQDSESGKAEVIQISGGEPTMHPQLMDILQLAKDKQFRYILLNTNGLRIAEDRDFVRALSKFLPRFEIYLQFDGLDERSHTVLRGRNLRAQKEQAIKNLGDFGIPVTLVATVQKHVNDHEIGAILKYGMSTPSVRGVNYQPIAFFGKVDPESLKDRITLTEVLEQIEAQTSGEYLLSDFVPLPCNVERVAMTFCHRKGDKFIPLTRQLDLREHLSVINNTFAFDADEYLSQAKGESDICQCARMLIDKIRPLIPKTFEKLSTGEKVGHLTCNMFRISVSSFVDVYNFDLKSMQKECVHVITPDLRRIPFSAYNMFHRKS
jgi:uncharacterized radical SAM superfamily Fe-S cluster-containing enzyme